MIPFLEVSDRLTTCVAWHGMALCPKACSPCYGVLDVSTYLTPISRPRCPVSPLLQLSFNKLFTYDLLLSIYYLLFATCNSRFTLYLVIYYSLFTMYFLLFTIYYLLFTIYYLLFIIYYFLFTVFYSQFTIYYLLSTDYY